MRNTISINNNSNINQVNHREGESQDSKPTIVQDMLAIYNEIVGGTVTPTKELSSWLVEAFKQKFKTIDRWKEYVKRKIWGKVKDTLHFLRYLLSFAVINAAMGEMGMALEPPRERTKEEALEHIEGISDESAVCLYVRKRLLEDLGANWYFSVLSKLRLHSEERIKPSPNGVREEIVGASLEGVSTFLEEHFNRTFFQKISWYLKDFESEKLKRSTDEKDEKMVCEAEIIGRIGFLKVEEENDAKVLKMKVSHMKSKKVADGSWCSETTWYRVIYSGNRGIEHLKSLEKGDLVRVVGDLNVLQGKNESGKPYTHVCILAKSVIRLAKSIKNENLKRDVI